MSRALLVFLFALLPAGAQEYTNRLTGAFGALNPVSGYVANSYDSAPLLSFDYGYRFHRHSQADLGVDIGFSSERSVRRNIYIPRFGYRAIFPFWQDRIEASLGAGGAHTFVKPASLADSEIWLVYGQIGANYAIDTDKRYRTGVMIRWYRDPIGAPVQQWVSVGFEFSYNFGR